ADYVTVMRNGSPVDVIFDEKLNMLQMIQEQPPFIEMYAPSVIDSVLPGSPMELAGGRKGTFILAVDGTAIETWTDFDSLMVRRTDILSSPECTSADSLRLRNMTLVLEHPGVQYPDTVTLTLNEHYMLGIFKHSPLADYKVNHISYNLLSCWGAGLQKGWSVLVGYVNDLKYVASAEGAKSVGSFITIGNIFPSAWDWYQFWMLTAFISIILAVMNILPIPGLDGGHIVILLYEAITGKEPGERFMEWTERIGLFLILALMLLAFSNDFRNFILPLFG
ncbi:MAG: site-2 protease family protein, partial [Bacteroidaceae bacterium]|nr:site-2 protease family protein [Bacteroidaceae bacterium]